MNYKEHNSTRNQEIKGAFVSREVYYCQSYLVEELFKKESVSYEDVSNWWEYTVCLSDGEVCLSENEKEEMIEALEEKLSELDDESCGLNGDVLNLVEKKMSEVNDDIHALNNCDASPAEIYEWWLISDWLADKIESNGGCILRELGCTWWGRQTTGQAILLDGMISRICEDMEILEGQPSEWKWVK